MITAIYHAMVRFVVPAEAARLLDDACDRAREAGEAGLEKLARGFRVVLLKLLGRTDGLDDEIRSLTEPDSDGNYDRYICNWAASMVALVDRDGPRLRRLMDSQVADLMANGLRENWLTMYWDALAMISGDESYLPQLRLARARAEAEGREAEADCVLALGYAAACRDDWEEAAEMLGAARGPLMRDTAGFIHHALLREQLVQPRLEPAAFEAATVRGEGLALDVILDEHGV